MDANYFTILWWVLPYTDMNQPWVYMCSLVPSPPPILPPQPNPLGYPWTPALRALLHAWNMYWSSISHMVIYMFRCYSLKSSHSRLLSQSPKVCSLYLCLFCCLAYQFSSVQFSCSVVSDSLWPHELQHAGPPCPSPLPEFTQTHVHRVSDAIQPSHPLSSPSLAPNLSQHQSHFQWVNSSHEVAKGLEFQL